jgi:regulatory protein
MPDNIVELKPRPRGHVTVKLAGGRFFTIPSGDVSLRVGAVVSDDEIARFDLMDQYFRGKDKALRLLSKRARSREEIRTALDSHSISESIREGILSELEETGLVDDRRFTREYVRLKMDLRHVGPHRLRHDLTRLGVRQSIVDDALDEYLDEHTQETMARKLALRRAGDSAVDEKTARRISDLLRRKGFDFEIINRVVYDLLRRRRTDR